MDLSERFFHWAFVGARNRRARRLLSVVPADLSEGSWLLRFEWIAAWLEQQAVRIALTDGLERSRPGLWLMPRKIGFGAGDEGCQLFGLQRLLFLHGAGQLELRSAEESHECSPLELIRSAQRMPEVRDFLILKYPGAASVCSAANSMFERSTTLYLEVDPSFERWSQFMRECMGGGGFSADTNDIQGLLRSWSPEWMGDPYCPIHLLLPPISSFHSENEQHLSGPSSFFPKGNSISPSDGTPNEIRVKTVARPGVKDLDRDSESPLSHVFEKVLTAEEYHGGSKRQDGSDESADHADALSELTLDHVIRGGVPSETIVKSDAVFSAFAADLDEGDSSGAGTLHFYPEWFERNKRYQAAHCRLFERTILTAAVSESPNQSSAARALSQKLSVFLNESRWKPGQKDGPELDLDALVRQRTQPPESRSGPENIYMGRKRLERDVAILILLDGSLSTDGWVGDRRIIDLMKSSIHLIGDAFSGLDDHFGVATFNSHTRAHCHFSWIKKFGDDWRVGRQRLQGVRPEGYTRIGPALRHAGAILDGVRARRKLVLLFSDAKPSDYDRYEGSHGLADVAKAVSEFRARGIRFKGVAVARENPAQLSRMFGAGNYQVLREPAQVGECVLRVFSEMIKG